MSIIRNKSQIPLKFKQVPPIETTSNKSQWLHPELKKAHDDTDTDDTET